MCFILLSFPSNYVTPPLAFRSITLTCSFFLSLLFRTFSFQTHYVSFNLFFIPLTFPSFCYYSSLHFHVFSYFCFTITLLSTSLCVSYHSYHHHFQLFDVPSFCFSIRSHHLSFITYTFPFIYLSTYLMFIHFAFHNIYISLRFN